MLLSRGPYSRCSYLPLPLPLLKFPPYVQALRESCERQLLTLGTELARMQSGLEDLRATLHTKSSVVEVGEALAAKADRSEMDDKLRDKASRG